jgi:hypothetical protein
MTLSDAAADADAMAGLARASTVPYNETLDSAPVTTVFKPFAVAAVAPAAAAQPDGVLDASGGTMESAQLERASAPLVDMASLPRNAGEGSFVTDLPVISL